MHEPRCVQLLLLSCLQEAPIGQPEEGGWRSSLVVTVAGALWSELIGIRAAADRAWMSACRQSYEQQRAALVLAVAV